MRKLVLDTCKIQYKDFEILLIPDPSLRTDLKASKTRLFAILD